MPSSYTLGTHFEAFVQSQLSSGRYNNASEVMRDALRLMEAREQEAQALLHALNQGENSGSSTPFDSAVFLQEMRKKHGA